MTRTPWLWLFVLLCASCATPAATQQLTLPPPSAGEQVRFVVRHGGEKLINIRSETDGRVTRMSYIATDAYAPAWLLAAGGELVVQTVGTEQMLVDGDCLRPAPDIPTIDPATIIGPQPGYRSSDTPNVLTSIDGAQLWQEYSGRAVVEAGAVIALTAAGSGTLLLPDNTTRTGSYDWTYQRTPLRTALQEITTQCARTALDQFPLPASATERVVASGVLTAQTPDALADVAAAFPPLLQSLGTVSTLDRTSTRVTLQLDSADGVYMLILDARSAGGTAIVVYRAD